MMKWLTATVIRALVLGVGWLALAGWDSSYAGYGLVSVAAATALSLVLLPPEQPRFRQWPRRAFHGAVLVGWFLRKSMVGGVDVAARALKPTPDIAPVVVPAPFLLPEGHGRQTAMLLMNLMPGTMVQQVVGRDGEAADDPRVPATGVHLHALSLSLGPLRQWEQLQRRVAGTYGIEL